jgi:hypothetical protein
VLGEQGQAMFLSLIALVIMLAGQTAEVQQSGTLTLACEGTTTLRYPNSGYPDEKSPTSMSIVINFTTRTVQGFGILGKGNQLPITAADDVTITFYGYTSPRDPPAEAWIMGKINRVTGAVQATEFLDDNQNNKRLSVTIYELKCRPTERMF